MEVVATAYRRLLSCKVRWEALRWGSHRARILQKRRLSIRPCGGVQKGRWNDQWSARNWRVENDSQRGWWRQQQRGLRHYLKYDWLHRQCSADYSTKVLCCQRWWFTQCFEQIWEGHRTLRRSQTWKRSGENSHCEGGRNNLKWPRERWFEPLTIDGRLLLQTG